MSSYLVVGMQKSGTSAVYAMLKAAMDAPLCSFEPGSERQIEFLLRSDRSNRLSKILYRQFVDNIEVLNAFDYKVHIVRDPRDIVVSYLLYWPLLRGRHRQAEFVSAFVDLLERKEADPASVTLRDFSALTVRHGARFMRPRDFRALCEFAFKYHSTLQGAHTLKYDALLTGDLDATDQYLGLALARSARVGAHISYNERQKALGSWRDWFTPVDVADYQPALGKFIEYFSFDPDWSLSETPTIAPEYGSGHVRKSVEKLSKFPAPNGELRAEPYYDHKYLAHLQSARSDGIESAMIELALAHFAGYGVEKSVPQFQSYLQEAHARGNVMAMIHLCVASRFGVIRCDHGISADALAAEAIAVVGARIFMRRAQHVEQFYTAQLRTSGLQSTKRAAI